MKITPLFPVKLILKNEAYICGLVGFLILHPRRHPPRVSTRARVSEGAGSMGQAFSDHLGEFHLPGRK